MGILSARRSTINILVVEDDRDIRELVCQSLAQNDFRTVGCRDVQEAKQLLAEVNPDCLVVDWMLPDGECVEIGDTEALFTGQVQDSRTTDYIEGRFG